MNLRQINQSFSYNDLNHRYIVRSLDLIERKTSIAKLTDKSREERFEIELSS